MTDTDTNSNDGTPVAVPVTVATDTDTDTQTQTQSQSHTNTKAIQLKVDEASLEPDGSINVKCWKLVSDTDLDRSIYDSLGVTDDDQQLTFTPWKEFSDGRGSLYSSFKLPENGTTATFTPEASHLKFCRIISGNRSKVVKGGLTTTTKTIDLPSVEADANATEKDDDPDSLTPSEQVEHFLVV